MPIYEYECQKCGHGFEREQKISDPPVRTCPECRGRKVTKLISRSSFVLKGGGWYADGYTDSKAARDKTTGGKETSAGDTSGEASKPSESKPSAAKESGHSAADKGSSSKSAA